ncbi:FAD-binding protein [bacterium 336/3]|nr:FAD-binding protein [bacterium 336/3]
MKQTLDFVVSPEIGFDTDNLHQFLKEKLQISDHAFIRLERRSIDARSKQVKVNIKVSIYENEQAEPLGNFEKNYQDVSKKPQVIVVGAGPAGMFAALRLIELGIKPIVIERGKDVQARRRDLAAINKDHVVNNNSNYCFGEGGAGTYSDGKLYTRSNKRGDIRRILEILVAHGAKEEILIEAHPHIGTNKLPKIVADLRESIIKAGGEVHFETKVVDFILEGNSIKGVVGEKQTTTQEFIGIGVILATGHSARDIFELLHKKNVFIQNKPFALGVRIEHPQQIIDSIQYHCEQRGQYLPPASYSLVEQVKYKGVEKGVFSFCMCPGGFIVPSATEQGEVVVNGMSPSRRDGRFANSGMVVAVDELDWKPFESFGVLAALEFQKNIEKIACQIGGNTQIAPAQRVVDFAEKKVSKSLLDTSYQPGLVSVDLREVLPEQIAFRLQEGLKSFGKKMKGYFTNEAQLIGVESRTSSPVSIPRDKMSYEHTQIKGLFPCGEGAGYAGGIMSAAMDGERCAEKLAELYG